MTVFQFDDRLGDVNAPALVPGLTVGQKGTAGRKDTQRQAVTVEPGCQELTGPGNVLGHRVYAPATTAGHADVLDGPGVGAPDLEHPALGPLAALHRDGLRKDAVCRVLPRCREGPDPVGRCPDSGRFNRFGPRGRETMPGPGGQVEAPQVRQGALASPAAGKIESPTRRVEGQTAGAAALGPVLARPCVGTGQGHRPGQGGGGQCVGVDPEQVCRGLGPGSRPSECIDVAGARILRPTETGFERNRTLFGRATRDHVDTIGHCLA